MPLITLLLFGGIETGDMIHLKGNLRNIAYEGGRTAARFNSNSAEVMNKMNALLPKLDIEAASITVELPAGASNVSELDRGELIKISVSAPAVKNTVGPLKLYS